MSSVELVDVHEPEGVQPHRIWVQGLVAAGMWIAAAALIVWWPDVSRRWPMTQGLANLCLAVAALIVCAVIGSRWSAGLGRRARSLGPWLIVLPLVLSLWEVFTAKLAWLPVPFFAPPQALLDVYFDDWPRLADSLFHSAILLGSGVAVGAITGFVAGVAIGWSRSIGYWLHPVLRILGPVPSTALLPLCFFLFPSSWSASVFLIALATWFPVTVLTWSGVSSVDKAYYDVARTLGAKQRFLIFNVAIPAALPHVFVGLFMGLGASFSTLVVAEMMGVKSGIGWYLQWAQGWAAYANMYAALLIMALACSGLISGLFLIRDRLLAWQQGAMKW
ncbi:ABC transporter permease [Pseudomonas sp. Pseu.R1]|uniref:ABC transporter permease n=1 Tax=Pseudomonas sp. Pseu.R1 TaxID=3379818 RepID=UPI003B92F314